MDFCAGNVKFGLLPGRGELLKHRHADRCKRFGLQRLRQSLHGLLEVVPLLLLRLFKQAVRAHQLAARVLLVLLADRSLEERACRAQFFPAGHIFFARGFKIPALPVFEVIQVFFEVHAPGVLGDQQQAVQKTTVLRAVLLELAAGDPVAAQRKQAAHCRHLIGVGPDAVDPGIADLIGHHRQPAAERRDRLIKVVHRGGFDHGVRVLFLHLRKDLVNLFRSRRTHIVLAVGKFHHFVAALNHADRTVERRVVNDDLLPAVLPAEHGRHGNRPACAVDADVHVFDARLCHFRDHCNGMPRHVGLLGCADGFAVALAQLPGNAQVVAQERFVHQLGIGRVGQRVPGDIAAPDRRIHAGGLFRGHMGQIVLDQPGAGRPDELPLAVPVHFLRGIQRAGDEFVPVGLQYIGRHGGKAQIQMRLVYDMDAFDFCIIHSTNATLSHHSGIHSSFKKERGLPAGRPLSFGCSSDR